MSIQVDSVDRVIKNTIEVMESSKYQIFEICDLARSEMEALQKEQQEVLTETAATIDKVDQLELDFRRARVRLSEVSRDFKRFKEIDIKVAYETATNLQLELTINREKEMNLRARRDDLQKRIRNLERSIERAETIGSQMNVALEYLSGDLNQVTRILESAKNRQLLGLKIILAQEEERKRIAREIHDGPAQLMANLVMRTEIAERMLGKQEYPLVAVELHDLKGQVRSGLEELRKIIFNLRPMALDDLGLVPALRKFVQDFEEKTKIKTRFEMVGKEVRLPSAMEVAMFRLMQEAFSNIFKHARASFVELQVVYHTNYVDITIEDNGVGFKTTQIGTTALEGNHFGLVGMQERLELLEGNFTIESALNVGTKIMMHLPINVEQRKEHS